MKIAHVITFCISSMLFIAPATPIDFVKTAQVDLNGDGRPDRISLTIKDDMGKAVQLFDLHVMGSRYKRNTTTGGAI